MEIGGHDTLMGAALLASGALTIAYTRSATNTLKMLALIGAAATLVIGFLLSSTSPEADQDWWSSMAPTAGGSREKDTMNPGYPS